MVSSIQTQQKQSPKTPSDKSLVPCILAIQTIAEPNGLNLPVPCDFKINGIKRNGIEDPFSLGSITFFIVPKSELTITATPTGHGLSGLDEDDYKEVELDLTDISGFYTRTDIVWYV
jgi:hypothetical protein